MMAKLTTAAKKKIQYEWLQKIDAMLEESAPFALYP